MNALRRMIGFVGDSPTYGRDRATLISGGTIGIAGLLLNFGVLTLVLPLMLDPDDRDFRAMMENLEFGQLLSLILLGGATAFATLLVPLRMVTVFWGPRVGRYFDQIVLSGISPLRFVIGKATSQNLFLALILFLLSPYLVLSLTLGGVDLVTFVAGLFLVWLYCIALALVTLWASLYFNELLAALQVIGWTITVAILGCIPFPYQPFVVTPFPALLHPVFASTSDIAGWTTPGYWPTFGLCVLGMTSVIGASVFGIHLGPLFGIIRENSTFGEVVRDGDSKRRRWSRLRQHIQRPSEIAFFYENRSAAFRRREGLLRWGLAIGGLSLLAIAVYGGFLYLMIKYPPASPSRWKWFAYDFHAICLTIHGFAMFLAVLVFSHTRNTTFLRVPLAFGRTAEVARLDTWGFLAFALLSTGASLATPWIYERIFALPMGQTIFSTLQVRRTIDFLQVAVEGTAIITIAGLVVYAFQRLLCLNAWIKVAALAAVGLLYFVLVCILPLIPIMIVEETPELRTMPAVQQTAHVSAMISPFFVMLNLFGEIGGPFPEDLSTLPFYVAHFLLLALMLVVIWRRSPKLRAKYLDVPRQEAAP